MPGFLEAFWENDWGGAWCPGCMTEGRGIPLVSSVDHVVGRLNEVVGLSWTYRAGETEGEDTFFIGREAITINYEVVDDSLWQSHACCATAGSACAF